MNFPKKIIKKLQLLLIVVVFSPISIFSQTVLEDTEWSDYYKWPNQFVELGETLSFAIEKFENDHIEPNRAIDLGCGAGRDTLFLATNGWQVTAVDTEKMLKNFFLQKFPVKITRT